MRRYWFVLYLILISMLTGIIYKPVEAQQNTWQYSDRRFRVPVTITASQTELQNKTTEFPINFSQLLQTQGQTTGFSENSIRVSEVDVNGGMKTQSVVFQFDHDGGYSPTNARGTFILYLDGVTAPQAARYFHIYFDTIAGTYTAAQFTPPVSLTDNVQYEGQTSVKISTVTAEYTYHKQGAGFASIKDSAGADWLGYHPTGGEGGNYRGIPNLVHPESGFHPGATTGSTQIESNGPLKVSLYSQTTDNAWKGRWEIYPTYAKMTMLAAGHSYWFLYEGTPGGSFEGTRDYYVTSANQRFAASSSRATDLPAPEWLYFGDDSINRVLFLHHVIDDSDIDAYKPMNNQMTVFGFGRNDLNKYLTATPDTFYIGIVNDKNYPNVKKEIESAAATVYGTVGPVQTNTGTTPTIPVTISPTLPGCSQKSQGDANCNNIVNLEDFEIWRKEFTGVLNTKTADFNASGEVNITDFESWRRTFLA